MAGTKVINEARGNMEEKLLEVTQLCKAFAQVCAASNGDGEPSWLWCMVSRVDALQASVEEYMDAVHQSAMPILRDMERLAK